MKIKSLLFKLLKCLLFIVLTIPSKLIAQEPMVEFLPYCTYGLVTGALIGGATLAMSEDPTSNMGAIARGASLGLYIGTAIGVYKFYEGRQKKSRIEYMIVPESKRFSALINYNF